MQFEDLLSDPVGDKKEKPNTCVVRLTTSYWYSPDGLNKKQTLRFLRRKCSGYNFLYEDACNIGPDQVVTRIVNLDECKDGIYKIITCNEHSSWETPHIIEDYDYKLIPLES